MIVFKAFDDVYGKEISSKEVTKEYNEQIKKPRSKLQGTIKSSWPNRRDI
ncbi:foldase protein PrsA [Enterococcus sp. GMD1E]|nr:foldase protein PrsA [Enterococcus sp. GMD1E]